MIRVVRTLRALMADKPACQECGGELKAMDGKKALGAQLETECTACGRAHLVVVEEMAENRLPGEAELLKYMREYWYYGAMLEQLDSLFTYKLKCEHVQLRVTVPQLLEVMVAYGDVRFDGKLYYPTSDAAFGRIRRGPV